MPKQFVNVDWARPEPAEDFGASRLDLAFGEGCGRFFREIKAFGLGDPLRPAAAEFIQNISDWLNDPIEVSSVPEPGMLALLGLGIAALHISRRRKAA